MKQLLAPLQKIANLIEEERKEIAEVKSFMTVNLKKASDENIKELKSQTKILTEIRELLKEQAKSKESKSGGSIPKVKIPGLLGGVSAGLAIITMAAALVAAAGIFSLMPAVSLSQLATAILIAGVFVVLAPIFVEISESLRGGGLIARLIAKRGGVSNSITGVGDAMKMAGSTSLAMVAMAAGVMLASWIFQLVIPVSYQKLGTAVLIGFAFIPLSMAFRQIIGGLAKARISLDAKGLKRIAMASLAMAAIALGIAAVANIWNYALPNEYNAPPIGWIVKTGLLIYLFTWSFSTLSRAVKGMSMKDMLMTAAAMPIIAIAIAGIAYIFSYLGDVSGWIAPPLGWTLQAGLAMFIFGIPFIAMSALIQKGGLGIKGLIFGALSMVALAGVILAVAWIFSYLEGVQFTAPPIGWSVSVAIAMSIFAIPLALLGLLATSGIGAVGIVLGAAAMILIAATIWVVAWIFSKLPDLGSIAQNFTNALMTPVNAMIDALVRFKNEIGIENMLPLAGGLLAVAGGWLALTAALAGSSVGGLIGAAAGVGKAIFDGFAKFFGGSAAETPISILDKLISRKEGIIALANPVKILGTQFAKISNNAEAVIAGIGGMLKLADEDTREELEKSNTAITGIALAYSGIASASKMINVTAINATTKMFEAIARIAESDGQDAISELAKSLMAAVNELAETVKSLEEASSNQQTGVSDAISSAMSSFIDKIKGKTDEAGKESGLIDIEPIVLAIQELEERFDRSIKVQAI